MIPRLSSRLCHHLPPTSDLCLRPSLRPFSSTSPTFAAARGHTPKKPRPRHRDPYANKHAEARRAANIARQTVLRQERAAALGDPIRGIPTPFLESFDTALPVPATASAAALDFSADRTTSISTPNSEGSATSAPTSKVLSRPDAEPPLLNHFLTPAALTIALSTSRALTQPLASSPNADPTLVSRARTAHAAAHATASEALSRILSLGNASSRARTQANTQRCIATFGRHATDAFLRPRPLSASELDPAAVAAPDQKTPRAGKDTGSSEVQIAILTAKIRVLADRWEGVERNDKVNKRNLRLLLHRRQKLLRYMLRKERGGERWRHLVGVLGLTEATWKGQIAVEDGQRVAGGVVRV
ncbi:hypothetical protein MMC34_004932 [Xylographa carneopallida]|nr:hypothetical protein [Xylographa carneopallida]